MYYDAVIFDLDGTLLDTLPDLHAAVCHALRENGLPERSMDEVRAFVGNGIRKLVERAVPENCENERVESVFDSFKSYYKSHSRDKTAPYKGVFDLVKKLDKEGVSLGVVSNKAQFAVTEIIDHYFSGCFHVCFGEREGVPRKPDPAGVLEAVSLLGGKSALYVGDSEVDVETAERAELDHAMVSWGFRSEPTLRAAGATVIAHSTQELYNIIREGRNAHTEN